GVNLHADANQRVLFSSERSQSFDPAAPAQVFQTVDDGLGFKALGRGCGQLAIGIVENRE
ncbi:MAG TPA: hypothetical protein DEQ47_02280, partial [Solibacterales bacterium]|nr:hypothetical protein [Bryobacterales bacterium]